jgi:hypothetical protein
MPRPCGPAPRGTLGFCSVGSAEPTIFSTTLLLSGVRRLGLVHGGYAIHHRQTAGHSDRWNLQAQRLHIERWGAKQSFRVLRSRRVWWRMDAVKELYLLWAFDFVTSRVGAP